MTTPDPVAMGRESFERQKWKAAYEQLSAADRAGRLEAEDVERLATTAYLLGREAHTAELLARAYHDHLGHGAVESAARCAFWLAFALLLRGETARGGGWLTRAEGLLAGLGDTAERGFLLVPRAYQSWDDGDPAKAHTTFVQAAEIGQRFGEADLITLAALGRGQTLIALARTTEGVATLDEAMVAVTADEVSPIVVGLVYCAVIDTCRQIFDLRRAQEWTAALSKWCAGQPDLVPYRGQCLVHRAEIMKLHGAWADALDEARHARDRLSDPPSQPAVGAAFYQLAELHRLRGEWEQAEEAYGQATEWGHSPQPGLALLRLGQGNADAAAATIRRVVAEAEEGPGLAHTLPAFVEIVLAANDVRTASRAAGRLATIAAELDAPLLRAEAAQAAGAVALAEDDAVGALHSLRRAWTTWQELDAPYEAARVRVLLGRACRQLADEDGAQSELDAARVVFERLGATPDLARLDRLGGQVEPEDVGVLTARELQVLALVVAGKTNRQIASELAVSEHTIRRHVQNIFGKLDVSSRAAATAYALQHDLV
jgi:DNA-binding CsgD family transcriptional regulator/tetratricopeptide (TPR) repeat protein